MGVAAERLDSTGGPAAKVADASREAADVGAAKATAPSGVALPTKDPSRLAHQESCCCLRGVRILAARAFGVREKDPQDDAGKKSPKARPKRERRRPSEIAVTARSGNTEGRRLSDPEDLLSPANLPYSAEADTVTPDHAKARVNDIVTMKQKMEARRRLMEKGGSAN
mmetsp:Transcript_9966/g.22239  ORF Transcript_9966/g.22239 Transcript_9966/m.22239 type:complete len:168 (-) Transcript_9966:94-597(-)